MMTLTGFLLARITEDEAVARAATHRKVAGPSHGDWRSDSLMLTSGILEPADRRHIARFDPARVLAECEAKRRIVTPWTEPGEVDGWIETRDAGHIVPYYANIAIIILCALALPYADHPDFQAKWRP